jgi:hypothetical protein
LHQVESAWIEAFAHAQHVGAQSSGLVHADPAAPIFHAIVPTAAAQVLSAFSPMALTELASVAATGVDAHTDEGGTSMFSLALAPHATSASRMAVGAIRTRRF